MIAVGAFGADFTSREACDWGSIVAMGLATYGFHESGPFFEKPIIDGSTGAVHQKDKLENTYFYGACTGISACFFALPIDGKSASGARYRHIKGYLRATAATSMITGFSKDIFGSPRPDADAREAAGFDERHIRDSFPSGHSSFAFASATYLTLYSWRYLGGDDRLSIVGKEILTAALFGGASWVAVSRVENGQHRPRDVIAGAAIGGAVAAGSFYIQESRQEKNSNISVEPTGDGLSLVWRF